MFTRKKTKDIDLKKLFRYDSQKKAFILDISIDIYKDLYNDWDFSPFKRRDLDTDLVAYIEESSQEIPLEHDIIINFFMPEEMRDEVKEKRSKLGLNNYFRYSLYKLEQEQHKYRMRAFRYGITGSLLVFLSLLLKSYVEQYIYLGFLPEGIVIGGWVFIWELFTILFLDDADRRTRISEYNRLIEAELRYDYYKEQNHFNSLK